MEPFRQPAATMPTPKTLDLLERALKENPNASEWARLFKVDRTTVAQARRTGRLSPVLAGQLAEHYGEPVQKWVALAALEAAAATTPADTLRKLMRTIVYVCRHKLQGRKPSTNAR